LTINLIVNFLLLVPSFLLAIYYPQVGKLAGYCGSFATMLCIYLLPLATYLKMKHEQIKVPISEKLELEAQTDGSPSSSLAIIEMAKAEE
jgi:hypothetical protein